jgi:hypothetical protein
VRRRVPAAAASEVPEWLRRFTPADWVDGTERPPEYWARADWGAWRVLSARRRWEAAGRVWLAENGRDPRDWYGLTRPGPVVDGGG